MRLHAAPGKGDALQRLLSVEAAASEPGTLLYRAHRSHSDPDGFLFHETYADEAAYDLHAHATRLDSVLRRATGEGLVSPDDPLKVELYQTI